MSDELQPDRGEVLQAEGPGPLAAVPVSLQDAPVPVRVQVLPHKAGSTKTVTVAHTTPTAAFLRADPRRAMARITSYTTDLLIAFSQASAQSRSSMCRWPKTIPYPHTATTEIWLQADDAALDTEVSVAVEYWAEGNDHA